MAPKPPKKYLDERRIQVNPEWVAWDDARRLSAAEAGWSQVASIGGEPSMYFPEKAGKRIPPEGAWIIVVEEPLTELTSRFRVPELSMWRARPHQLPDSGLNLGVGKDAMKVSAKQAIIATPHGDLHLWPHEYVVVDDAMQLASHPDAELHSLGGRPVLDEDELFYLMSRGVPHSEAALLLFSRIESLDFVYVTFPDDVVEQLRGAGQSLRRHIALNPR